MLRIECTCGKFLKVGDALLGKKIKCPACGEIQLVKKPAAAMAAKPKSSPDIDEAVSPAPKKKAPMGNGAVKSTAPPKRHLREDHEDDDDRPRKKPVKKSGNNMMLLLVGGGAAALLLLVGVAVGGYFMFFHKSTPEPVAKKNDGPKGEPAPKVDQVAIKLFVPHKKGNKRSVDVNAEIKMDMSVANAAELPADMTEKMPPKKMHNKIQLKGTIQTLEVSAKDEETKVALSISSLKMQELADKMPGLSVGPGANGIVAIGTLVKDRFEWSGPLPEGLANVLSAVMLTRYLKEAESDMDMLYGTAATQDVGGTWPINKAELAKVVKSEKLTGGPPSGKALKGEVKGGGKFVGLHEAFGWKYLDIDINLDVSQSDADSSFSLKGVTSSRVPLVDGNVSHIRKVEKSEAKELQKFEMESELTKTKHKVAVQMAFNVTITTETSFVGNEPVQQTGTPVDSPKTSDILKAELRGATAEWVPNQSKVKYSVNYKALANTKPNSRADYTLYLQFDDGEGGKKMIPVDEPVDGSMLGVSRPYSNPSLAVAVPPKGNLKVCYLVLMEKVPGNLKEKEICKVSVTIGGTPPNTASAPEKLDIKLSNAKVQHDAKKKLSFSVDYKVTAGKFDPNKMYRIYVLLDGDKVKKGAVNVYEVLGSKLQQQDTITKDFTADASVDAKFTLWVVELPPGAKTGDSVSNIAAGSVAGSAPPQPGPAPYFQVNIAAAQKMKNPANPKAPAQQFSLQFTWALTKGELNKQAAYTVYIVPAGGVKTPLGPPTTGATFPASSSYANTLPLLKVNSFQIHIEEQVQGQQPRVVSNNPSHNIK